MYTGAYIDFTVWGDDTHPRVYPRDIDYTQGKGASTPVFWMHNATTRPWEWRGQSDSNMRRAKKRMSVAQLQADSSKRQSHGKGAGKGAGKGKGKGKGEKPSSPPPPHLAQKNKPRKVASAEDRVDATIEEGGERARMAKWLLEHWRSKPNERRVEVCANAVLGVIQTNSVDESTCPHPPGCLAVAHYGCLIVPCSKRTRKEKLPLPEGGTWEYVFPDEWEWETPKASGKRKQEVKPVERATSPRLETNEAGPSGAHSPVDHRRFSSGNMFDGLDEEDMEDGEISAIDPGTDAAVDAAMQEYGSSLDLC